MKRADVLGVEAIHVLVDGNRFEHGLFIEMLGQGQLHEDAVDVRIGVQFGDLGQHRRLVDRRFVGDLLGMHADGQAAIDLVAHVNL